MGIIRTVDRSQNFRDVGFQLRSGGITTRALTAPALVATSGQQAGTLNVSCPWPAGHRKGDLGLIVFAQSGGDTTPTLTGWEHINGSPVVDIADATGVKLSVLWRRAPSDNEGNQIGSGDLGDNWVGVMTVLSGVRSDIPPGLISATSTKTTASTTFTWPSVTTPCDNCRVMLIAADPFDQAGARYVTPTNANLTGISELADFGTAGGDGSGFLIAQGHKTTAGATGTTSGSMTITATNAMLVFVLEPAQGLAA